MRKIQISDHFDYSKILLFSLPTIGMLMVDNTYSIADGFFISNYIGATAFASENLIFPPFSILSGIGLMFGVGASAVVSKELGAGRDKKARSFMSMVFTVLLILSILMAVLVYACLPIIAKLVGASESMMPFCVSYGKILAIFMPLIIFTMAFQPMLITAERSDLGFMMSLAQAVGNILMTWIFVVKLGWGMRGAALGTGMAWLSGVIIPIVYFFNPKHNLHFVSVQHDLKALGEALYNGASEMVDVISGAVVAIVFNYILMLYLGESGVAAYAVGEYVKDTFLAAFEGISMSIVPVVGYHFGAGNHGEIRSLWRKGMILAGGIGILMTVSSAAFAGLIAEIFVGYDESLKALSVEAVRYLSLTYLFIGACFFSSSYFTGLEEGTLSLTISLSNSLIGPLVMIYLLPKLLGIQGIWLAEPVAQCLTLLIVVTGCFFWWKRKSPVVKNN